MSLFKNIRSLFQNNKHPEKDYVVTINDNSITCSHPTRKLETINWDDIEEVLIITTDEGPFLPDVWFVFAGNGIGCSIPQGATNLTDEVLFDNIIPRFENFNYEKMIEAMQSTDDEKFICWKK